MKYFLVQFEYFSMQLISSYIALCVHIQTCHKTKESNNANQFSDSLNDADPSMSKDMPAFWSMWQSKFSRKQTPSVIDNRSDEMFL